MTAIAPANRPPAGRLAMTPGRRVALLLGLPVVLVIIVANSYSLVQNLGMGSYQIRSYSVPLATSGLTIGLNGGDGTVRGVPAGTAGTTAGEARVSGTVRYDLGRPTVRRGAGSLGLDCPRIDLGNCSLDATVNVPEGTPVDMATGGGDLSAAGLSGATTLSTDGGNVSVSGDTGDLTARSGGGDVTADSISGTDVRLSTDGGNVSATAVESPHLTAETGRGDITLTFTSPPQYVQVNTSGGNVTIVVPRGSYIVDASTAGGSVSKIQSTPGAHDTISATSGGGDITIRYPDGS